MNAFDEQLTSVRRQHTTHSEDIRLAQDISLARHWLVQIDKPFPPWLSETASERQALSPPFPVR